MKKISVFKILTVMCMCLVFVACGKQAPEANNNNNSNGNNGNNGQQAAQIKFKDAVGREIVLDKIPEKIIADSPESLRLYSYIDGTNKLLGVSPREKKGASRRPYALAYSEEIEKLPELGGEYNIDNYEAVLLAAPDVFFTCNKKDVAEYDEIQKKIGAPVVVLDVGAGVVFDPKLYESIEIIGKATGKEQRAKEVVDYMEGLKKDLHERTKDIPQDKIATAYAGGLAWSGAHGIEGTRENYPLFNAVNVKNVVTGINKDGLVEIDKEQILKWDPEYIFIDLASIHLIQEDYNKNKDFYKSLRAFKEGKVFAQIPFVWCNVNVDSAMANAYYVGKMAYPEQFKDVDPAEKTNEIYEKLVGKKVYDQISSFDYGGFQQVTIDNLDKNLYVKKK